MKYKLKDYSQFLNEEVDLKEEGEPKGNPGIPSGWMRSSKEEAQKNLGIKIDRQGPSNIGSLISQSTVFLTTKGLDTESESYKVDLENRYKRLEDLAKEVILDEFGSILSGYSKPIELDIRLLRPNEKAIDKIKELGNKAEFSTEKPEFTEEEEDELGQDQPQVQEEEEEDDWFKQFEEPEEQTQDSDEEEEEIQENPEEEIQEEEEDNLTNKDVAMAIDKTKILNMITQGAGKATKDIIKSSETVKNGLMGIFGDSYKTILDIWSKTSDEADKLDWQIPVGDKQSMFKNMPEGIAGAVKVDFWKKEDGDEEIKESNDQTNKNDDYDKVVINSIGIDFPMLIHETVKGIYQVLQSSAIKSNKEFAEEVKKATSSYRDESEDFRYGTLAQAMFRDFINTCKDADKYPKLNILERVYYELSHDKERGGKYTDEEFLEITNSIFSSFDKVLEDNKIRFIVNKEKFNSSIAKDKIERIIQEENKDEDDYQEELRKWELDQQFGASNYDDDKDDRGEEYPEPGKETQSEIDRLTRQTAEREQDLSNLTQSEIQKLVDDAFDKAIKDSEVTGEKPDYSEVQRLSAYLESANIYLKEIDRIFELKKYRK